MSFFDTLLAVNLSDGGGGGGTDSYTDLKNKPQINNVTLTGNKTTADLIPLDNGLEINSDGEMAVSLGDGLAFNADGEIENQTEANPEDAATTELAKLKVGTIIFSVVTKAVNDLANYYTKSEVYTKSDVYTKTEVNNIAQARFQVVDELPSSDIQTNVIYLVPKSTAQTDNDYDEYIYALKSTNPDTYGWEKIGDTEIDLSGYVTTSALNTALADYTTTSDLTTLLAGKQNTLTFDSTPTASSNNPVTSGGIKTYVDGQIEDKIDNLKLYVNIDGVLCCDYPDPHIYGAEYDGTTWTRTDEAADFADPNPYYAGMTDTPSSPFDNCMPWSGMEIVEDADAGTLVKIPKFYYKLTLNGDAIKIQIADGKVDGFLCSPAHMDRGDGKGERDFVYGGRYNSAYNYKSVTNETPLGNKTRSEFRTGTHSLGNDIWQNDYAMWWTIRMLYLVEFANFNSQEAIGYGCGNGSSVGKTGYTDNMPYHTGTMQATRTTYGLGTQYRHFEGLWDNVDAWCDGIRFNGADIYCILNPSEFSDTDGGVKVGTRPTSSGWITSWSVNTSDNKYAWALYPSTVSNTQSYDTCAYNGNGKTLYVGGNQNQNQDSGLFHVDGGATPNGKTTNLGSRVMKLP